MVWLPGWYGALKGTITLSGEATLSKVICLRSEKESTLKGKNLLPKGENSFLLERTPFPERLDMYKMEENLPVYDFPVNSRIYIAGAQPHFTKHYEISFALLLFRNVHVL